MSTEYKNAGSFRLWCRMNVPSYSSAKSYEELLSDAVDYLNSLISQTTALTAEINSLITVFNTISGYDDHYPTAEDYINQVNNELDIWASSGVLNKFLEAPMQFILNQEETQ